MAMSTFTFKSISKTYTIPLLQSNKRLFSLFGPSEHDWKRWAKEYGIEDLEEEENAKRDPREVTPQELRDVLRLQGKFAIDHTMIPQLELPQNAWYSDSHIYIQQTNVDNVWRMGYSAIRFIGSRHVEWLVFDSEPKDIKLYSESLMYYSICDWRPVKIIMQSINDIQFSMCSPFHRIQIISVNEKIQSDPSMLIDDEVDPNWRWIITFRWINEKEEIFSKPPIDNGRYGKWYDDEQYLEWIKDGGKYKKWQIDQVRKMAEDKALKTMDRIGTGDKSAKEERNHKRMEEMLNSEDNRPKYLKLDDEWKGRNYAGQEVKKSRWWKSRWFPF